MITLMRFGHALTVPLHSTLFDDGVVLAGTDTRLATTHCRVVAVAYHHYANVRAQVLCGSRQHNLPFRKVLAWAAPVLLLPLHRLSLRCKD